MDPNKTEIPASVLVGVTGGIAAYKAAEIVRSLVKEGLDVHVVMTRNAQEFITPLTLQVLSGNPVWTETFHLTQEQEIGHIAIVDRSSLFLVAPATANVLGKVAADLGIESDQLVPLQAIKGKGMERVLVAIAKSEPGIVAALGADKHPGSRRKTSCE